MTDACVTRETVGRGSVRLGSLFSGYGGLDLAVESVFGATTAWVADIDPGPRKILAHRFPHAPNLGDVTAVDWSSVEPVDIIAGGSPCQDVSHAGRRAGMTAGTRSNLWVQMREAIATIRPRFVVWENVRGAYSAAADSDLERGPRCVGDAGDGVPVLRALGRVLGDLAELGFDAQWHGVRAADIGACHGRWRVFVIAYPHDAGLEGRRVRGRGTGERAAGPRGLAPVTLLPTPRGTDGTKGGPNQRGSSGDLMLPSVVQELITGAASWGDYAPAIARWERVLGRPAPAPTEPNAKGNPRLSPRFVEWLMGLPAGWVTDIPISRNDQLKALGNGVVPQQAVAALADMLATLRQEHAA